VLTSVDITSCCLCKVALWSTNDLTQNNVTQAIQSDIYWWINLLTHYAVFIMCVNLCYVHIQSFFWSFSWWDNHFLAHLSTKCSSELLWSFNVRRPSSVRPSVRPSTIPLNNISSETAYWILTKLHRNDPWVVLYHNC